MNTLKVLVGLSLGVAVVLLVTTDKGKSLREDAMDAAKKLRKKMDKLARNTGKDLADLQKMVGNEIEGLSDDARERIMTILDGGAETAKNVKKQAKQMA